jgi:hypothetical protein
VASDGIFDDQLGISVAVGDNVVAAGANEYNDYRGAVYVFAEPPGGWQDSVETAKLTASDSIDLGWSVAVTENGTAVVGGAFLSTVGANQFQGSAYVWKQPETGWRSTSRFAAELIALDGQPNDELGTSVGASDGIAVAGAPQAMIGNNT